MKFFKVEDNKEQYLDLLLLGDEQEDMIQRYLPRGDMYALDDGGIKAVCVVTREGGVAEIKNIAVHPLFQRSGYGRRMIEFIKDIYRGECTFLQVGTGESPLTLPFYKACGFTPFKRVKNFFTNNYRHPIYEGGVLLADMIYLRLEL